MIDLKKRVSLSLPESVIKSIDRISAKRGFESRSALISEMLNQAITRDDAEYDSTIMAGNISLIYSTQKYNCQKQLAELQRKHIDEVISSLHVQLEDDHVMEVIIVQGPAIKLKKISDELITCKGVKTGQLTLSRVIMPPLYSRGEN